MIIDCHGHYTTAPKALQAYRDAQIAALTDPSHVPAKGTVAVSDDQIRESLEGAQLKLQRERGTDVTVFSPRASAMAHHIGEGQVGQAGQAGVATRPLHLPAPSALPALKQRSELYDH